MLLYQYAYYFMRERDKHAGMSISFTKFKAPVLYSIVETLVLATVYIFIDCIILGQHSHKSPSSISSVVIVFLYAWIVCYINQQIIGSDSRIHHYKEIFDAWDKKKHMRWKIYVIFIAVSALAAFFIVGEISQNGLNPQNWKY